MSDFREQFLGTVGSRKQGSDIADAIGMPDAKDLEVLTKIIQQYKRKRYPLEGGGYITGAALLKQSIESGRRDFSLGIHGSKLRTKGEAEVSADSGMRYAFELPEDLGLAIESTFPSIFRSKKHLRWFASKFPELTIAGKKL